METVNEAIEKRKPIRRFGDKKVESENMKAYSIVAIGYPAEDADLEAVDGLMQAGFTTTNINLQ